MSVGRTDDRRMQRTRRDGSVIGITAEAAQQCGVLDPAWRAPMWPVWR